MTDPTLNIRPAAVSSARVKTPPSSSSIPVPFTYTPSDDGTDENLLILLHGLGDTHVPFAKLGKQLKLPQTATMALRGTEQIPILDTPAFQWYPSFDPLGEMVQNPNPTTALSLLSTVITHLIDSCGWPSEKIHLFGFGQGGTVAAEFALKFWRESSNADNRRLGSIVSIAGPLLSYPTLPKESLCPTPIMLFYRAPLTSDEDDDEMALKPSALTAFRKGFAIVKEAKGSPGGGMPRSRDEWEPTMRFWSENLSRRQVDGLYEVMSGISTP